MSAGFDPSRGQGRREEAVALLPFFTEQWEPLRDILERSGDRRSASQMVSRARELEGLGLIESRWGNAMKVWRKSTGGNDAMRRVAEAIRKRFYELVDHPLKNGDDAMLEVARAAIAAWYKREARPAIAMEARQGRNRETGCDPKDDSAGPKDIAR